MNWRAAIPTALTLGNLACGVLAIASLLVEISSSSFGGPEATGWAITIIPSPFDWINPHFALYPSVFILFAAVFDLLDGLAARMLNCTSQLGAQLDSLAGLVSFGVAPSLLLIEALVSERMISGSLGGKQENPIESNILFIIFVLFVLAVAFRLARFNNEAADVKHFIGLPSPAAGLLIIFVEFSISRWHVGVLDNFWILLPTTGFLALAMVSRWPFLSFKGSTKEKLALVAVFAAGAILAWLTEWQPWVVLATLALYAVVSRVLITPVRRAAQ
jgi:CDP-diacylglycerol---serine O-phosphatidyltransferase